jgi:hypothetical protein
MRWLARRRGSRPGAARKSISELGRWAMCPLRSWILHNETPAPSAQVTGRPTLPRWNGRKSVAERCAIAHARASCQRRSIGVPFAPGDVRAHRCHY